jgi:TIGR03009 family protein
MARIAWLLVLGSLVMVDSAAAQGIVSQGMASQGMAPQGMASQGMAPQGTVPRGAVPQSVVPESLLPPALTVPPGSTLPLSQPVVPPQTVPPQVVQPVPQPSSTGVPFQLTVQEEAHLDRVLNTWQQRSGKVDRLECRVIRWQYDPMFGNGQEPFVSEGRLYYRAPDKCAFHIQDPPEAQERWVCDTTSIYQFDFQNKQLTEFKLPPQLHGKAIAESPLPLLFGGQATKFKQRYFLRAITPPELQGEQTWLEVYPRLQADAASFRRARLILTNKTMTPYALEVYEPGGQSRTSYKFEDLALNVRNPLGDLLTDPFRVATPLSWKKVVEDMGTPAPAAESQISRQPVSTGMR